MEHGMYIACLRLFILTIQLGQLKCCVLNSDALCQPAEKRYKNIEYCSSNVFKSCPLRQSNFRVYFRGGEGEGELNTPAKIKTTKQKRNAIKS